MQHKHGKEKEQCTNISTSTYRESQVWGGGYTELVAFSFQSWHLLWCVDLSVQGPKNESLFCAHAPLLIPAHLGNSPLFYVFSLFSLNPPPPSSSSVFSSSPKYLSHPFCPSCPLARSEVETCVSLHLHGEKGRKVKSDLSLSPSLPPSLQRGADRLAPSMELSLTPGR